MAQIDQIAVCQIIEILVARENQFVQRVIGRQAKSCFRRQEVIDLYFIAQGHLPDKKRQKVVFDGLVEGRLGIAFARVRRINFTGFDIAFFHNNRLPLGIREESH